jgi:hypothetical protein
LSRRGDHENLVSAVLLLATALAPRVFFARRAEGARLDIFSTPKSRAKKVFCESFSCCCWAFFAVRWRVAERAVSRGAFSL